MKVYLFVWILFSHVFAFAAANKGRLYFDQKGKYMKRPIVARSADECEALKPVRFVPGSVSLGISEHTATGSTTHDSLKKRAIQVPVFQQTNSSCYSILGEFVQYRFQGYKLPVMASSHIFILENRTSSQLQFKKLEQYTLLESGQEEDEQNPFRQYFTNNLTKTDNLSMQKLSLETTAWQALKTVSEADGEIVYSFIADIEISDK
jgi:hypothetical protein